MDERASLVHDTRSVQQRTVLDYIRLLLLLLLLLPPYPPHHIIPLVLFCPLRVEVDILVHVSPLLFPLSSYNFN